MVDSPGLENRYSFQELSRVRIPLSPFSLVELLCFFRGFGQTVAERKRSGSVIPPSQARKKKIR